MSRARARYRGALYFVTRRTHEGVFRLRPDEAVTNAIGYIVAVACWRYGVELVAFCAMSNHYHATLYDPEGRVAEWECYVNSRLAMYLNARHGRSSYVFDGSEGHAIALLGPVFIAKSAYTLANPTKAGLVYGPEGWPGLLIGLRDLRSGRPRAFRRPESYFDAMGDLPETVELTAKVPPGWEQGAFCDALERELGRSLEGHRAARAVQGQGWLGAEAVRRTSPFARPNAEPGRDAVGAERRRPLLAGSSPEETRAMLARYRDFLGRYRAALASWREGKFEVVFPEGTWRLWRAYGALRGEPGVPGERWHAPPSREYATPAPPS